MHSVIVIDALSISVTHKLPSRKCFQHPLSQEVTEQVFDFLCVRVLAGEVSYLARISSSNLLLKIPTKFVLPSAKPSDGSPQGVERARRYLEAVRW